MEPSTAASELIAATTSTQRSTTAHMFTLKDCGSSTLSRTSRSDMALLRARCRAGARCGRRSAATRRAPRRRRQCASCSAAPGCTSSPSTWTRCVTPASLRTPSNPQPQSHTAYMLVPLLNRHLLPLYVSSLNYCVDNYGPQKNCIWGVPTKFVSDRTKVVYRVHNTAVFK